MAFFDLMNKGQTNSGFVPTRKGIKLAIIAWFIGLVLLVLATTDLFRESFFQQRFIMVYFLIFTSALSLLWVVIAYKKRRSPGN